MVILLEAGMTVTLGVMGFWLVAPLPGLPPLHDAIETII
jgi:hypothetical protein